MPKDSTYTVELDFRATFQIELKRDSPQAAYKAASEILQDGRDLDYGRLIVDRIDSFQVLDSSLTPVSIRQPPPTYDFDCLPEPQPQHVKKPETENTHDATMEQ